MQKILLDLLGISERRSILWRSPCKVCQGFLLWRTLLGVDAVTRYFDGLVQYGEGYDHRIHFSGSVETGDISITIGAVTMEDNGTYACSVRLRDDPPREQNPKSVLQLLLVAPSKPECKILGTAQYGETINLTCVSHEGSPTPTYTWKSFNVQNEPRVLPHTQGQQITLKNISADTSGFYICTSTNVVGTEFCNMTVSVVPPSMNIALYAGIIGGVVAAIVVIGIIAYCCCCRESKEEDYEMTLLAGFDNISTPEQHSREQEDRNEPSVRRMPPRQESTGEDVENA
uniref:Glycoprotein A33 n=1 Tax=Ficedula albicollis TaxID=59894 RepID=U3JFR2_FICAL